MRKKKFSIYDMLSFSEHCLLKNKVPTKREIEKWEYDRGTTNIILKLENYRIIFLRSPEYEVEREFGHHIFVGRIEDTPDDIFYGIVKELLSLDKFLREELYSFFREKGDYWRVEKV